MAFDIENFLDAHAIAAPQIFNFPHYRRSLARLIMTVFMMREDRKIRDEEIAFIRKIVCAKFNLDDGAGKALCDELCAENEHAPSIDVLVSYVKENSTVVERVDCIREMWEIAICDNELHLLEDKLAQRCSALLNVEMDEITWMKELAVASQSE